VNQIEECLRPMGLSIAQVLCMPKIRGWLMLPGLKRK